jgi:putative hydrolase
MNFLMDLHTHTVESGHAYSTLQENIAVAKAKGLTHYGLSDHGPKMPGTAHLYYFQNMYVIPREFDGIKILRGVEANILDHQGTIDMNDVALTHIDYAIASMHLPCVLPGTKEENTSAMIAAMKHPKVVIIGHPDDSRYPLDYEKLVKAAKENNCLLEINNTSLNPRGFRKDSDKNVKTILELCKKENLPVVLGSDAHFSASVGEFGYILPILTELNFPEELIINSYPEKFLEMIGFAE